MLRLWLAWFGPAARVHAATFESDEQSRPGEQPASSAEAAEAPGGFLGATREQAAAIIAEALLKADHLLRGSSPSVDLTAVSELSGSLSALGDRLEESIRALASEREQLVQQLSEARQMLDELSRVAHALQSAGVTAPTAPGAGEAEREAGTAPAFTPDRPLSLLMHGVTDFNLLVRLERVLTALPAVSSAAIESYQDGQARFVVNLERDIAAEAIRDALESDLGSPVAIVASEPSEGELQMAVDG
jgi:hypothetical protein